MSPGFKYASSNLYFADLYIADLYNAGELNGFTLPRAARPRRSRSGKIVALHQQRQPETRLRRLVNK